MFKTAYYQNLVISHQVDFGLYLKEPEGEDVVLLPKKEIPKEFEIGDEIRVFIYRDSEDRQIATTKEDLPEPGDIRVYEVTDVNKVGAFLDWGLSKELFLPFSQQRVKVKKNRKYLATTYVDKSDRICATTYVGKFLRTDHKYLPGEAISGTVFRLRDDLGAIIAVDNKYLALLPQDQITENLKSGDQISGFVARILEDGKIDFSLHKAAHLQRRDDADIIFDMLQNEGGFLPFNDKSNPDDIKEKFGLSKKAFKRAIGNLLRLGKIKIENDGIRKI